jgi:hypothetical protein
VRRREILRECEFRPEAQALAQFEMGMAALKGPSNTLKEEAALGGPGEVLATYRGPNGKQVITERDFIRQFNERMIRTTPRDAAGLVSAIEDIVVEEYDYAEAVGAGLDQEPKFVQDRRNFEFRQALALYEKEILAPRIPISAAEVRSYYVERSERYAVPGDATGTLYRFASAATAREASLLLNQGGTAAAAALAEEVIDPAVIERQGPPLVPGRPNGSFLGMPDGRTIGPFEQAGRAAIFLKRSSGGRQIPPLEEIESVVRQHMLRERLDEAEMKMFPGKDGTGALRIYFEFSQYGIADPFGASRTESATPFHGRTSLYFPGQQPTIGLTHFACTPG